MKEDNAEMADTRIFRFELNDDKPKSNIRKTFTSSDSFFYSLLNKRDALIMLAGAEAFGLKDKLVLHTNRKVEALLKKLKPENEDKPTPSIWIIAGDYKVYEEYPYSSIRFKDEFFSDHYDKVDLYNFSNMYQEGRLKLITNKDIDDPWLTEP